MAEDETPSTLPACQRCKLGKKRCDRQAPKCSVCAKANTACIIIDPITTKQYTRGYIHDLELKEQALSLQPRARTLSSPLQRRADGEPETTTEETPRDPPTTRSVATSGGYVGEGSGVSFLRTAFAGSDWDARRSEVTHKDLERPQLPEASLSANLAPPFDEASALLDNYFTHFHVHHTFMMRGDVHDIFERVYRLNSAASYSPQDYFRLFMIFAVSGVSRFRAGRSCEHPYGYYLAALTHIDAIPLIGSADAVQNLLLIARFGMYHHIGTSLWDISHFCMRQCIELGYHLPALPGTAPLHDQKCRRIFWECYVLDRYSSGILGRPFAIADEDVEAPLPVLANDDEIGDIADILGFDPAANTVQHATELTVCVFCIKLRRITSRIYSEFYTGRKHSARSGTATPSQYLTAGHVQTKLQEFLTELVAWRKDAPVFAFPRSLYERSEWYDFMMEKDKLILIRGAMHAAPKRKNGTPSADHLDMCYETASKVITLYADMQQRRQITWTRSYFQVIFTAGLSVIYCLSLRTDNHKGMSGNPSVVLGQCTAVLDSFKHDMPDAGSFAVVFSHLKQELLRKRPTLAGDVVADTVGAGGLLSMSDDQFWPQQYQPGLATFSLDNSIQSNAYSEFALPGFNPSIMSQEPLDWLMTEGMMENIEAGMGEYAWGSAGLDPLQWDSLDLGHVG